MAALTNSFLTKKRDYLTFNGVESESVILTPEETKRIVSGYIDDEFGTYIKEQIIAHIKIKQIIDEKMAEIEKHIAAYIDFKIDLLTQGLAEKLITRRFEEEVDRRVDVKIKKLRGNF